MVVLFLIGYLIGLAISNNTEMERMRAEIKAKEVVSVEATSSPSASIDRTNLVGH